MFHQQELYPSKSTSDDSTATATDSRITSPNSASSSSDRGDGVEEGYETVVEVTKEDHETNIEILHSLGNTTANSAAKEEEELTFVRFCYNKLMCKCLGPLLVIAAIIAVVMVVFDIRPTRDDIPFADFIFSRDGWQGLAADELPRWPIKRNSARYGEQPQQQQSQQQLRLEMINELDDHWQSYFDKSINEWNNTEGAYFDGDRVLDLKVTQASAPDPDCDFIRGKFAVCNGNYGDTTFHGVNEILVYGDSITASVAKLNEYYLQSATEARKQYTMCHEIGHGFGLPHSDENFYNLNLGNCMDYTDRPWTNTSPDQNTYELLQEIYGGGSSSSTNNAPQTGGGSGSGTVISSQSSTTNDNGDGDGDGTRLLQNVWSASGDDSGDDNNNNNNESVEEEEYSNSVSEDSGENSESGSSSDSSDDVPDVIPEIIFQRASEAAYTLETKFADPASQAEFVLLHRDDYTASFQIELGDGFFLQAHFLLAN